MKSKKGKIKKGVSKNKNNKNKNNGLGLENNGTFNPLGDKNIRKSFIKKFWITVLALVIVLALLFLIDYIFDFNLTGKVIDPNNLEDPLGIGINPENMPETPEELANVSREYLIQEWKKVAQNSTFIGPLLVVANPILRVFCGSEFSPFLEFFVAFFVALVLLAFFTNGLNVAFRNFFLSLGIGFLINVIAVAGGAMKLIVPKIVFLLNNKWIIASFFIACAIVIWLFDYIGKYINKMREKKALNKVVKGKTSGAPSLDNVKETIEEAKAMKKGYDEEKERDTSTWD